MKTVRRLITVAFIICLCIINAAAEELCWVMCQPDSYVNVRKSAKKTSEAISIMECGDCAYTERESKYGFVYLSSASNELGCGWVHKGYVVYDKPVIKTYKSNIYSDGRVACWRSIGGTKRCWVQPGDIVTVYATSSEWCVTNKGFIKTEHIGANYELLLDSMATGQGDDESTELYFDDDEGEPEFAAVQR